MKVLSSILETFLICHVLLAMSSLCIGRLKLRPYAHLQLARLLLITSFVGPIIVGFGRPHMQTWTPQFHALEEQVQKVQMPEQVNRLLAIPKEVHGDFEEGIEHLQWQLYVTGLFVFLIAWRLITFLSDFKKVRWILHRSHLWRSIGALRINISEECAIPFSIRIFNNSFIVLPLAMMGNASDIKIAIAHEGQHHRQKDCVFAYFLEFLGVLFWANPGLSRWRRHLSELQEFSCDEALVGRQKVGSHDYGCCLYRFAQTVLQNNTPIQHGFACGVGMVEFPSKQQLSILTRRLLMFSEYQVAQPRRMIFRGTLMGLYIMAPLIGAYAAFGVVSAPYVATELDLTHVDGRIQHIAEEEIQAAVKRYRAKSGAVIVADVETGQIVAFAENNKFSNDESWAKRIFSPGSTLKPFVAAAAIEAGVASEFKKYSCLQPYMVEGTSFINHNRSFAEMSVTDAIAQSANVCVIKMAEETGAPNLKSSLRNFGFDADREWQSDKGEKLQLAHLALGQSLPVTLATMTNAYGMIARNANGSKKGDKTLSSATVEAVHRILIAAVERGIANRAAIYGISVAGKTGTMVGGTNTQKENLNNFQTLALFGGYAPANKPRYVSYVVIEDGYRPGNTREKGSGGLLAAPVFREVMRKSLQLH